MKKENNICDFIKGNVFENEVGRYLRNKICSIEGNKELPDVYYAIKDIIDVKDNNNKKLTFFYNEFDSVFLVKSDVVFDKNIFRINCKYENNKFENSKITNPDILGIKGGNIVFVECKYKANFDKIFNDIIVKINKFMDLIDNIFGTEKYGITILYLYDTQFIYRTNDYETFTNCVNATLNEPEIKKMKLDNKLSILTFYVYDNIVIYNYANINDELNAVKIQIKKDKEEAEAKLNEAQAKWNKERIDAEAKWNKERKNAEAKLNNAEAKFNNAEAKLNEAQAKWNKERKDAEAKWNKERKDAETKWNEASKTLKAAEDKIARLMEEIRNQGIQLCNNKTEGNNSESVKK